jgi:hypothetical protein
MVWSGVVTLKINAMGGTVKSDNTVKPCDVTMWFDDWDIMRVGTLSGIFQYLTVYRSKDGDVSEASNISDEVVVRGCDIWVTNIPSTLSTDSRTAYKDIYRIGGTSTVWSYLSTMSNVIQDTFFDNIPEEDLGEMFVEGGGVPFTPKAIEIFNDKVVIGNLTSPDSLAYPDTIMVSEENSVHMFKKSNMQRVGPYMGSGIRWLLAYNGWLYVGKDDSIWRLNPDDLTQKPICETNEHGGVGLLAACKGENEFYFVDKCDIVSYNGSSFETQWSRPVRYYISSLSNANRVYVWMAYFKDTLLVGIPVSGYYQILCYYTKTKSWYMIPTGAAYGYWSARCSAVFKNNASTYYCLHLGSSLTTSDHGGCVYRLFDPIATTDVNGSSTTDISCYIRTPDRSFGFPHISKDYARINVTGSNYPGATGVCPVTVTIYKDMAAYGANPCEPVISYTGTGHNDLHVILDTYNGNEDLIFTVKISSTGTPDKYQYSTDGGTTWSTAANTSTSATLLGSTGVYVMWEATTGHDASEVWTFYETWRNKFSSGVQTLLDIPTPQLGSFASYLGFSLTGVRMRIRSLIETIRLLPFKT